jgi:7-cyano-7-deazaguanine synthase
VLKIRLPWGGSSLLGREQTIPSRDISSNNLPLPSTYVPGRNTIFISFALSLAETLEAPYIFIGANAVDYSGYPDCRPRYYDAWNRVLDALGTHVGIRIPLLHLNKAEIIRLGMKLKVPYGDTWSCYQGGKKPCGVCDSCRFRAKGFAEAGSVDPALPAADQKSRV